MTPEFTSSIVQLVRTSGLCFGCDLTGHDTEKRTRFINQKMRVNDVKVPIGLIDYKQFYMFLSAICSKSKVEHDSVAYKVVFGNFEK